MDYKTRFAIQENKEISDRQFFQAHRLRQSGDALSIAMADNIDKSREAMDLTRYHLQAYTAVLGKTQEKEIKRLGQIEASKFADMCKLWHIRRHPTGRDMRLDEVEKLAREAYMENPEIVIGLDECDDPPEDIQQKIGEHIR